MYTLNLNEEELKVLMAIFNTAVKAVGLQGNLDIEVRKIIAKIEEKKKEL